MVGDRQNGRIVANVLRKREWHVVLMDMIFKNLADLTVPSMTIPMDIRIDGRPLILLRNRTKWMFLSADRGKLFVVRYGRVNAYGDPEAEISAAAMSPDGHYAAIVVSGRHPRLSMWSLSQGRCVREIPFPESSCFHARFDVRGRYLSCTALKNSYVWDVADLLESSSTEAGRSIQ